MIDELLGIITHICTVDCARCQRTETGAGEDDFVVALQADGWWQIAGRWHCWPCTIAMNGKVPVAGLEPELEE